MCRRAGQKQDGEYRSNGAKGSTQHRFEIPPRIFPWLKKLEKGLHRLTTLPSRRSPVNMWFWLKHR
jgi:hypothetical protein